MDGSDFRRLGAALDAAAGVQFRSSLGDPYCEGRSIVDLTGPVPVLKRAGAISAETLRKVVPDLQEP